MTSVHHVQSGYRLPIGVVKEGFPIPELLGVGGKDLNLAPPNGFFGIFEISDSIHRMKFSLRVFDGLGFSVRRADQSPFGQKRTDELDRLRPFYGISPGFISKAKDRDRFAS